LKMSFDQNACVNCGACARTCKMNVNPMKNPNSTECIRCGECIKACPKSALKFGVANNNTK
ncbi:MAG: 4Fe-4S binding protein, partial [Butyrivibrio sp.]|nr:4Fe-4S binding protein [Butyrivibrio sp.]